jgi:hypothetical protein
MLKCNHLFSLLLIFAGTLYADVIDNSDPDSKDMDALRRWLQDKRFVTMKEIGGDLSISGDVRTEFQATNERVNDVQQQTSAFDSPMYGWDAEVNLMLDYRTDRTWAAIKLEFNNNMGQNSGTTNKIKLEKGYLGGRLVPGDTFIVDAEIGRRYLYTVFDSRVEFASLFDGLLFRFTKTFDSLGDYYFNFGGFVIGDVTNHYASVAEMGALGIGNTGFNMKYSIVDWYRPGGQRDDGETSYVTALANQRYRYLVSQLQAYYQFYPEWMWNKLIKIYAAGLINHLAVSSKTVAHGPAGTPINIIPTGGRKANLGWYAGVTLGLVKKQGDWALDFCYQWVQSQTVPDFDMLGVGRGNTAGVGTYTVDINGGPFGTTQFTSVGSCNYKGFEIEALYAITNSFVVQQNFSFSRTLNTNIGPNVKYSQYEMEFIYAF